MQAEGRLRKEVSQETVVLVWARDSGGSYKDGRSRGSGSGQILPYFEGKAKNFSSQTGCGMSERKARMAVEFLA